MSVDCSTTKDAGEEDIAPPSELGTRSLSELHIRRLSELHVLVAEHKDDVPSRGPLLLDTLKFANVVLEPGKEEILDETNSRSVVDLLEKMLDTVTENQARRTGRCSCTHPSLLKRAAYSLLIFHVHHCRPSKHTIFSASSCSLFEGPFSCCCCWEPSKPVCVAVCGCVLLCGVVIGLVQRAQGREEMPSALCGVHRGSRYHRLCVAVWLCKAAWGCVRGHARLCVAVCGFAWLCVAVHGWAPGQLGGPGVDMLGNHTNTSGKGGRGCRCGRAAGSRTRGCGRSAGHAPHESTCAAQGPPNGRCVACAAVPSHLTLGSPCPCPAVGLPVCLRLCVCLSVRDTHCRKRNTRGTNCTYLRRARRLGVRAQWACGGSKGRRAAVVDHPVLPYNAP